jgi:tetratricopeptide (TPR) repeat protein
MCLLTLYHHVRIPQLLRSLCLLLGLWILCPPAWLSHGLGGVWMGFGTPLLVRTAVREHGSCISSPLAPPRGERGPGVRGADPPPHRVPLLLHLLVTDSPAALGPPGLETQTQESVRATQRPAPETSRHRVQARNQAALEKYQLAKTLEERGKDVESIEALRAAIQLQPDFPEAHFSLGVLLARQGGKQSGAALDEFLEVLRLDPKHADARVNLSNLLEQGGNLEAGLAQMHEALRVSGGTAEFYALLGEKQVRARKYSEAIQSFHKALELDARSSLAQYGIGMALRSLGRLSEARSEFEAALRLEAEDPYAHYQLSRLLVQAGEFQEAMDHLQESIRLKPTLSEAHAELGGLYRRLGKLEEAEQAFRSALESNPDQERACYALAQLLQARGKNAEAKEFFDRVEQIKQKRHSSNQAASLNARGVDLMNHGRLDEALVLFRDALLEDPQQAEAAYNQGLVLARLGKTMEAVESFRLAIRLRPGFVLAESGLGLALKIAGDPSAEKQLQKAGLMEKLIPNNGIATRTPPQE